MDIATINKNLAAGNIDNLAMLPHIYRLAQSAYVFDSDFGLDRLPNEPGIGCNYRNGTKLPFVGQILATR